VNLVWMRFSEPKNWDVRGERGGGWVFRLELWDLMGSLSCCCLLSRLLGLRGEASAGVDAEVCGSR
jgi:hypothetical protein